MTPAPQSERLRGATTRSTPAVHTLERLETPLPASYNRAMAGTVVGRAGELDHILELLEDGAREMRALVIEGEAGIGKTTLWREGIEHAHALDLPTLIAQPAQAESLLPFAALGDLLEPVLDERLPALAPPLRTVLEIALQRRASAEPAEQLAVSRATLEVLALENGPLLIAVDDVQWLDSPSERTLEFVLRRLRDAPTRVLVARRSETELPAPLALDRALPYERLHSRRLGPMTVGELDELLRRRLDLRLPRPKLVQLRDVSGGNPFYALEIARSASEDGFHVPVSLAGAVEARLDALPAPARDVVLLAAAAGQPTASLVERAAGSSEGLEKAIARGVLVLDGDRLRFTHPLLAAVAYESMSPWQRRARHSILAEVTDDQVEAGRQDSLAAEVPDGTIAARVAGAAEEARRRGGSELAAELATRAADLTPADDPDVRRERLVAASDHHMAAGNPAESQSILESLVAELPASRERAGILWRLADKIGDDVDRSIDLCEQALAEANGDDALGAEIHSQLATFLWLRWELEPAEAHARATIDCAERLGDVRALAVGLGQLAELETLLGRGDPGSLIARAVSLEPSVDSFPAFLSPTFQHAVLLVYRDEYDQARSLFLAELERRTAEGDEATRAGVLYWLAHLELRAGNWGAATRMAEAALVTSRQATVEQEQTALLALRGLVAAHVGDVETARESATRALGLAQGAGDRLIGLRARGALGFLELTLGDAEAAHRWLEPAMSLLIASGTAELSHHVAQNEIEALVSLGELGAADEVIEYVEAKGKPLGQPWHGAIAARGRALVTAAQGDMDQACTHAEAAVGHHERLRQPFELGRTLLVRGKVERRAKHRAVARESLTRALELFDELGAPLWAEQASAELARIPGRSRASAELTETERGIAELVAEGLSNKEVAARLFVTVRTVEANLTKVYAKLGIRSRTELASRFRR
jgi:DNA-binding CsgD family transcriptional regulator